MSTAPNGLSSPIAPFAKPRGSMTDRERFLATMRYEARDRMPLWDFGLWQETFELWRETGWTVTPTGNYHQDMARFFGMDEFGYGGLENGLCPRFPEVVLEDRGDTEVIQDGQGVRLLRPKTTASIPQHMGHTLVDRESWETHFRWRLNPDEPKRIPEDYETKLAEWQDTSRNATVALIGGSSYGWVRNWMGVEEVSYLVYDEPALFEEIIETIGDCICACMEKVLADGGRFEAVSFWEDMCYNAGPLLSPEHFKRYLSPFYKRVMGVAHRYGIEFAWVDCDGKIDELIPLWLEAGVNIMFPIEVGTWGQDPVEMRRRWGKDLRLMGGFNKRILARGRDEIEAEVHRLAPLVEEGGYIPFCDHRVPPDVSLENYAFYIECARKIWASLD